MGHNVMHLDISPVIPLLGTVSLKKGERFHKGAELLTKGARIVAP